MILIEKICKFILVSSLFLLSSLDAVEYACKSSTHLISCIKSSEKLYNLKDHKLINGHVIDRYPSGNIKVDVNYKNGVKDGYENWYLESGSIWYRVLYKKGKKLASKWSKTKDKKVVNLKQFENSGKYNPITATSKDTFTKNGKKIRSKYYDKAKLVNVEEWYYDNGKLKKKFFYYAKRTIKIFYTNSGKLKTGRYKHYNKDGKIKSIDRYDKGTLVESIIYHKGKISKIQNFLKDVLVKNQVYKSGVLSKVSKYDNNGYLKNKTIFDKDGYKDSNTLYTSLKSKIYTKYKFKNVKWYSDSIKDNIVISTKWYDKDGHIKNGIYRNYYSNKKPSYIASYKDGLLNGEEKVYHHNGNIKSIKNYIKGKVIGISKKFNISGNIIEIKDRDDSLDIIRRVVYRYYQPEKIDKGIVKRKIVYNRLNKIVKDIRFKKDLRKNFNHVIDTSI